MHDAKPRVMMESIKNVAVSDLVPHVHFFSLISPLFPSQCPCDKIFLHVSMDSTLQCVCSGNFCARDIRTISPTTKCGAFRF